MAIIRGILGIILDNNFIVNIKIIVLKVIFCFIIIVKSWVRDVVILVFFKELIMIKIDIKKMRVF